MDLTSIFIVLAPKPGCVLLLPGPEIEAADNVLHLRVIKRLSVGMGQHMFSKPEVQHLVGESPARIIQSYLASSHIEITASSASVALRIVATMVTEPSPNGSRMESRGSLDGMAALVDWSNGLESYGKITNSVAGLYNDRSEFVARSVSIFPMRTDTFVHSVSDQNCILARILLFSVGTSALLLQCLRHLRGSDIAKLSTVAHHIELLRVPADRNVTHARVFENTLITNVDIQNDPLGFLAMGSPDAGDNGFARFAGKPAGRCILTSDHLGVCF